MENGTVAMGLIPQSLSPAKKSGLAHWSLLADGTETWEANPLCCRWLRWPISASRRRVDGQGGAGEQAGVEGVPIRALHEGKLTGAVG
jgi:hypothetical protein